jgi:hypothetical protein
LCAASHHFGNRGHDCLDPHVSRSTVTKCCIGKHQTRRNGIHVAHLSAFVPIKYRHMPTGGTAPPLQSRQVQISSKSHRRKGIGPTCGFTSSPDVGLGATIGTLQIRYPRALDLSPVPQRQTLHPAGTGSRVTTCPCSSRPAPDAEELWHRHMPCGTGHTT